VGALLPCICLQAFPFSFLLTLLLMAQKLRIPLCSMPILSPVPCLFPFLLSLRAGPCLLRALPLHIIPHSVCSACTRRWCFVDGWFFANTSAFMLLRMVGHSIAFHDQPSAGFHFLNCLYGISVGRDPHSLTLLHCISQPFAHPEPAVDAS
jgi:hypothetical protein